MKFRLFVVHFDIAIDKTPDTKYSLGALYLKNTIYSKPQFDDVMKFQQ